MRSSIQNSQGEIPEAILFGAEPNGEGTTSISATIRAVFDKCIPVADAETQTMEGLAMKQKIRNHKYANMESIISFEEINATINTFKNNKALEPDNFKIEMWKELWKIRPIATQNLFNNCFRQESFPKLWKESRLRVVPKDEKRDGTVINSYMPIALLFLGKIYEKIIVQRL